MRRLSLDVYDENGRLVCGWGPVELKPEWCVKTVLTEDDE